MGLKKEYLRYGRRTRDHILGWLRLASSPGRPRSENASSNVARNVSATSPGETVGVTENASGQYQNSSRAHSSDTASGTASRITYGHERASTVTPKHRSTYNSRSSRTGTTPLSMLISQGIQCSNNRLAVIMIGIITLVVGILLSTIPWLDYFILKNLRLWNNTLSYHYWQRPGVIRLTKVYIFNVTNPESFLSGEKPRLQEVGPFVYREDMQKVNIKFYDNYTVSYQHKKILEFVPELSVNKNTSIVTPNIPLLTLTSLSPKLGYVLSKTISVILTAAKFKPFINVTADQLVFGYDDPLVTLAHRFYPKHIRPMERMGLLLARNGTLTEVSTINTGHNSMHEFGYISHLNGLDHLPHWQKPPCTNISGSEGSFFPPRDITKSNVVYVYDKDLCRVIPLQYVKSLQKDGIDADLYSLPSNSYGDSSHNENNKCFDTRDYRPVRGLQNISPCQYGAPVYISNPHFYQSDPQLLSAVEGLQPNNTLHETYFKIQPKLGVPLEGKVRIQLNLRITQAKNVYPVRNFRTFIFPVMWLEEGISEVTPSIRRWIYLATVFGPFIIPILSFMLIVIGLLAIMYTFVCAYKNYVFSRDPTLEILEMGRRSLRRGSSFITQQQHKLTHRDSYTLLKVIPLPIEHLLEQRDDILPIVVNLDNIVDDDDEEEEEEEEAAADQVVKKEERGKANCNHYADNDHSKHNNDEQNQFKSNYNDNQPISQNNSNRSNNHHHHYYHPHHHRRHHHPHHHHHPHNHRNHSNSNYPQYNNFNNYDDSNDDLNIYKSVS